MRVFNVIALLLLSTFASFANGEDILDVLLARPETRTIAQMVKREGADQIARQYDDGISKFTFLAVTNAAYTSLPRRHLAYLAHPRNREVLKRIVEYHVIPGAYTVAELVEIAKKDGKVSTHGGESLTVRVQGNQLTFGKNAKIVVPDLAVDQGYVHIIDTVLLPKNAIPDG